MTPWIILITACLATFLAGYAAGRHKYRRQAIEARTAYLNYVTRETRFRAEINEEILSFAKQVARLEDELREMDEKISRIKEAPP